MLFWFNYFEIPTSKNNGKLADRASPRPVNFFSEPEII